MQNMNREVINGYSLHDCKFEGIFGEPMVTFRGTAYYRGKSFLNKDFSISSGDLVKNVLALGSPGSGKTNVISQFAAQLSSRSDNLCIIFDTKGDYKKHRGISKEGDLVLEDGPRCPAWNIFDEITSNGNDAESVKLLAREISIALFRKQENNTTPFFYQAATDIFTAILLCMIRANQENPSGCPLNNKALKDFVCGISAERLDRFFRTFGEPDVLNIAKTYLGTDGGCESTDTQTRGADGKHKSTNTQALGVMAELRLMVNSQFLGIFEMEPSTAHPSFSIIRYLRTKCRGNLFVEYDIQKGETLSPVYSLLFDLAMKEALSLSESGKRKNKIFFILDELSLLPYCTHLQDTLNFGRGLNTGVIAGLQSIDQLNNTHAAPVVNAILGGFGSLIAMPLNDPASREFVSRRCGTNIVLERTLGRDYIAMEQQRIGHVVEEWDIQALTRGQAIIQLPSQIPPFKFQFCRDPYS